MISTLQLCAILVSICHLSFAWQQQPLPLLSTADASAQGRRSFFSDCSSAAATALLGSSALGPLLAPGIVHAEDDEIIDVYFGCGCVRFPSKIIYLYRNSVRTNAPLLHHSLHPKTSISAISLSFLSFGMSSTSSWKQKKTS